MNNLPIKYVGQSDKPVWEEWGDQVRWEAFKKAAPVAIGFFLLVMLLRSKKR